jgi:YD repeat-containing protein
MCNDGLGRLTEVIEDPGAAGSSLNYVPNYAYDALDDLQSVTQSGLTRSFSYDGLRQLIAAKNPENASALVPARLTCPLATSAGSWTTCYSRLAIFWPRPTTIA